MQFKIPSRRTLFLVTFLGFFCMFSIFNNILRSGKEKDLVMITPKTVASYFLPVRLNIPGINVDANFEYVGLTANGAMGVPKGPVGVAWYNLGPRPGEIGSAVIAGHSGYKNNRPAVFDNLHKLQKGDKLYVVDETGTNITFVVRESKNYDPKADATDVFSSNDGKAHLNLITCEGIWDEVTKSRSERLVVFTDREIEQ